MKLKYKKLVIVISVATLALSFFILTLIPTGGSQINSAEDAELMLNQNEDINKLIRDYYAAKKKVDIETMGTLVSDPNQLNRESLTIKAAYVEDYQNINCYVIKQEDADAYQVFASFDIKLKNIQSLAPGLAAFYVTVTSDGKYTIYLSALDEVQEEFINSTYKNEELIKLREDVNDKLQEVISKDESLKQFYQTKQKEIEAAEHKESATPAPASPTPVGQATQAPAANTTAPTSAPAASQAPA
ncbi:MAG: hypothetical protein J1F22_03985 [Lachnospiraceae bacterium]|nr:hypothetical protein [Lachnospiraceae bacterium]